MLRSSRTIRLGPLASLPWLGSPSSQTLFPPFSTTSQEGDYPKFKDRNKQLEDEIEYWKKKYKEKEKEIDSLKKEIEKLTKTNNRYQVGLFDHGNFKHPGNGDKKPKGGQKGHSNTNKEGVS